MGGRRRARRQPEGSAEPLAFSEGWNIGKPDMVFEMPEASMFPRPARWSTNT